MRPRTSRSALSTHTSTRQDWLRAASTISSTTSSTSLHGAAAHGAGAADPRHVGARAAAPARCGVARPTRSRVSTRRWASASRVASRPATPRRRRPGRVPQARHRLGLGPALHVRLDLEGGRADLVVAGAHRDRAAGLDPVPEVGVQEGFELGCDVVRGADDQAVELLALVHPPGHGGRVPKVLGGDGGGVALGVILGVAVVAVVAPGQLVELVVRLHQLAELEHEHAGPLPVGEQDAEALVLVDDQLELADGGRVVHHQLVPDRHRQLHHPPERLGRAREDRQAPHVGPVEAPLDELGDAPEVIHHRGVPVRLGPGVPQHQLDLTHHVALADAPPSVHVEVARGHRSRRSLEAGQFADLAVGDCGHGTSDRPESESVEGWAPHPPPGAPKLSSGSPLPRTGASARPGRS